MRRFDGPVSIQCSGLTSGLLSATSSPGRRVSSVVALSTEIALFRDLLRWESSERFGRDIFCYVRPARNPCIVPDLDRRLEAIVDAGPDVAADLRPPLMPARRVGGVGGAVPGRDVRGLADLGFAGVRVRRLEHRHHLPGLDQQPHRISQIELALRVDRLDPVERGPQFVSREHVDGGVDLPDRTPAFVDVGVLDDLLEPAVAVADDAAVGSGIGWLEGQHGRGGAGGAVLLYEFLQQLRAQAWMVAGDDEQLLRVAGLLARRA